jgi:hypothetical protein
MALNESSLHRSSVPFTRQPLTVISGIPIFIEPDQYTRNYDRIARDHLASLDLSGTNPFMADEAWATSTTPPRPFWPIFSNPAT